jgi:adenine-specific DNA methylase
MNNEENTTIRPIHYLGSKLRMLDTIKQAVDYVDASNGCVCDLFSGSGTVSRYLSSYRDVIAADIQMYSSVLCEATMTWMDCSIGPDDIVENILNGDTRKKLKTSFGKLLEYEQTCIEKTKDDSIDALYEIIEKGSIYIYLKEGNDGCTTELKEQLNQLKNALQMKNESEDLDSIITRYYGGLYFSYSQAIDLDCIEHYVFENSGLMRTKLLAALLSTTSEIVNTVGKQFAQPLKVRDSKGNYKKSLKKKILDDRSLNVFDTFGKWLEHYFSVGEEIHKHRVICDDYKTVLHDLANSDVKVVYADPPYTRYHYSRYYHVLETICLHDNPVITTTFPNGTGGISRAIYREGRHQSPFCIKSQAEKAFEELFIGVKALGVPLVLSYSPFDPGQAVTPRLQTIDQLIEKAKMYFSDVSTMSPGEFTHSKLNATDKNFESNHEAEMLIICKNR